MYKITFLRQTKYVFVKQNMFYTELEYLAKASTICWGDSNLSSGILSITLPLKEAFLDNTKQKKSFVLLSCITGNILLSDNSLCSLLHVEHGIKTKNSY